MSGSRAEPLIGIELAGAGDHPAAWRAAGVQPLAVVDGSLSVAAAKAADEAGIDFATFSGTLEAPATGGSGISVALDALGLAANIAPLTQRLALIPAITTTYTEPFHVQASIATLDWVSQGRAGWLVEISDSAEAASIVGRRDVAPSARLWREAGEVVEVSRALWDSWEDDAIIKDTSTGRFIDRDKLHYVDYRGTDFSIKGPSIVPRPPQGNPVVAVRYTSPEVDVVAADADLVLIPSSPGTSAERVQAIRQRAAGAGREVRLVISASVLVSPDASEVRERSLQLARLGDSSVIADVVGTPEEVAGEIRRWLDAGADGVHLRPAALVDDAPTLLQHVVPLVRGADRGGIQHQKPRTLRERLRLDRPVSQYAHSD